MRSQALVVNMRERGPGQMIGMGSTGSVVGDTIDAFTGGALTEAQQKADRLELFLKISIGASIISGTLALMAIFRRR